MVFITDELDLKLNKLSCLYFYTNWMPFNKKLTNILLNLKQSYSDVSFFAIDAEIFKSSCKRFNVQSVPQIILFKDGVEKCRIEGICMSSAIKSAFNKYFLNMRDKDERTKKSK